MQTDSQTQVLLSVRDVATRLGTCVETIRRYIREEKLRALRLGGDGIYRIETSELDRFLSRPGE